MILASIVIASLSSHVAHDRWLEVNAVLRNDGRIPASAELLCKSYDKAGVIVGVIRTFVVLDPGEAQQVQPMTKPVRPLVRTVCKIVPQ